MSPNRTTDSVVTKGNFDKFNNGTRRQSRTFSMPAGFAKQMFSGSLIEQAKDERVSFKGQQYVQGVFRMYD